MDAHVGAADLGLAYMKGEQPHCGFPEKNYAANAERLARAGHRVVVVEQTETPAQLAARKAATKSKDSVVRREKVAVLTLGTLVDDAMCEKSPEANFVLSIVENSEEPGEVLSGADREKRRVVGVCAADCASGRFLVGAWRDDDARSGLRAALVALAPVEIVAPAEGLSAPLASARGCAPSAATRRLRATRGVRVRGGRASALAGGEIFLEGGFGSAPGRARGVRVARARRRSRRRARRVRRDDVLPRGLHARRRRPPPRPRRGSGGAERERRRRGGGGAERRPPFRTVRRARRRRAGGPRGAPPPGASRSEDKSSLLSTLDRCAGAAAAFSPLDPPSLAPPPPSPRAGARSRTCAGWASTPSAARARRFGARRTRSAS